MNRIDWRKTRFADAVGQLSDRSSGPSRGIDDLMALESMATRFGRELDARLESGESVVYSTFPELMDAVDSDGDLGVVARKRIDGAHKISFAGALCAIESLVFEDLQPPAGIMVTSWTRTTSLRKGTPGVVVLDNGVRTRTVIIVSVVGGDYSTTYNLPLLIEPASDPTNIRALALQALKLAKCGRLLVRHYAPKVGSVPIGSLPILLGRIRAAGPHPVLGGIITEPIAMTDLPEVIDELARLTEEKVPFVAHACYGSDGKLTLPEGWYLDVTPRSGDGSERSSALTGLGEMRRRGVIPLLLGRKDAIEGGLLEPVPDVEGRAWLAEGCMLARGLRGVVPFGVLGYVSLEGRASIALTNLPKTPAGMLRLSMAIEGLFGSAKVRARCRRRVARFVSHIDLPTDSNAAARRVFGLIIMSFRWTVVDRVSGEAGAAGHKTGQ